MNQLLEFFHIQEVEFQDTGDGLVAVRHFIDGGHLHLVELPVRSALDAVYSTRAQSFINLFRACNELVIRSSAAVEAYQESCGILIHIVDKKITGFSWADLVFFSMLIY
ncbi:MAG: hypothetical protein JXA41_04835 [Deltaproteobacteria bacterium]|nr:hypothetical protein [Deltaproteobacteria bacterium]